MPVVLSTSSLSTAERSEFWRDAVSRTFVPLEVDLHEETPSAATITSHHLGSLQVSVVTAGPQTVVRDRRTIARDGAQYLTLTMQHRGTARLAQDGRRVNVRPGELALSDSARPFTKEVAEPFSFTAFHLPRTSLDVDDDELRAFTCTVFSRDGGGAGVVAAYLERLARGDFPAAVRHRLARTTSDLLAVLFQERRGRFAPQAPEAARAVTARVKDHVLRHLADPALSPETIAAAHHVSVRYLHKLFEHEGVTVARWIRHQRLERCRAELARTPVTPPVAAVAHRWGFVSPAHFSRVFRAAYGMSPREWQATARRQEPGAEGPTGRGRAGTGVCATAA
ncbi:helix-turn-helix domain-containing protein [Streptomyces sp. NPDC008150]|uniref:AraC-like ligand-binding domain-containing protein n=1 Tax=Streptomyces sp. NPDC008150 TaxID=3364816 RepID=UPI0036E8660A